MQLQEGIIVRGQRVDSTAQRERVRQRRLLRLLIVLSLPLAWFWVRQLQGNPIDPGLPDLIGDDPTMAISIGLLLVLMCLILIPFLGAGQSPHVLLRPSDSNVRLADVVGADATRREAIDTLNLFLAHETFKSEMGGSPRRGVLFEGPPGTGKTYLAKALAAEAGVPFLFVSASAFQSMYYGQTNRKIRTYFKALRKAARAEGGAIGFIEEFDAIGGARSGMNSGSMREGIVGVVNELLVQMQSFDMPTGRDRIKSKFIDAINVFLPTDRALPRPTPSTANILVVAATNRASDLDPALMRPGRFDRVIHFDLPPRADRVEIAEYYLSRKAHEREVNSHQIADITGGYSPVRIERLLDEALIVALRAGRQAMTIGDVVEAQLTVDIGLSHPVGYHPDERRRVAIHEAGHALVAALVGRDIRIASILRRGEALGLVSHGDSEERHLRTPTEGAELIAIALAGRAAEIQEYGEASSGIASDLAYATTIASQLVGQLGACDTLISLEAAAGPMAGNLVAKVLSDPPARVKVESILESAADRVACMVLEHRTTLITIADGLCDLDELSGDQINQIVTAALPA
ncbi:MAG: peptidase M41 family protein [Acidimicrobiaceae bacterium]|nr:MAG: peptidase M41 family protein [Acidimicrobiaceae bacterium]